MKAAKEKPEQFGKFQEQMDQTGKVDNAFRQVRAIQKFEALPDAPPLDTLEKYNLIVAGIIAGVTLPTEYARPRLGDGN